MLRILVWFTDFSVRHIASIFRVKQAEDSVLKFSEPRGWGTISLNLVLLGPDEGSITSFETL